MSFLAHVVEHIANTSSHTGKIHPLAPFPESCNGLWMEQVLKFYENLRFGEKRRISDFLGVWFLLILLSTVFCFQSL